MTDRGQEDVKEAQAELSQSILLQNCFEMQLTSSYTNSIKSKPPQWRDSTQSPVRSSLEAVNKKRFSHKVLEEHRCLCADSFVK